MRVLTATLAIHLEPNGSLTPSLSIDVEDGVTEEAALVMVAAAMRKTADQIDADGDS